MEAIYKRDVQELLEYTHPKGKTTLADIYAQTYNVSKAAATRATRHYNSVKHPVQVDTADKQSNS